MNCDVAREALSARIDGEREPVPAARVDEHLESCAECRDWRDQAIAQAQALTRRYARRQVSWFRRYDGLAWVEPDAAASDALDAALARRP